MNYEEDIHAYLPAIQQEVLFITFALEEPAVRAILGQERWPENNIVRKRDNETNVYGINIKQNYSSSTYADQGYLFQMVDLKDSNRPVIYVRAWQPEKFDDGRVIDLSDFSF